MSNINRIFAMLRAVVLGVTSLFAVIVLVMAALITDFTGTYYYGAYFTYAALAMATAILTLLTLPVMLILSIVRKGAFTSMIMVELIWTGLLWVLWLSTGGVTASTPWINYCSTFYYSVSQEACMETQALTAFSFLNWIFLLVSNIFLFSLAIRQHNRGHTNIWTSYVTDTDFTAPGPANATEKVHAGFAPQYTGSTYVGTPQHAMMPLQHGQHGPVVAQV